jgi:hypothetical protein
MQELPQKDHIFRHIKKSWMEDEFINPRAFRLREEDGKVMEKGLSVNWVEYFGVETPQAAIPPLVAILKTKGRKVGGESKFARLNVGRVIEAAAEFVTTTVQTDDDLQDPSHALIEGYEAFNDEVSEALGQIIIDTFPVARSAAV